MEIKALDNQKVINDNPIPMKSNYGIFGRKGSGKTSLILNLIMNKKSLWYKKFNLIFLISPTASKDDKMQELIKDIGDNQYFDSLDDSTLESIKQQIEADITTRKKKGDYLILYDDVIHMLKGKGRSKLVDQMATQNRHFGVTNVYLLQKYNSYLSPLIRSNLDLISFFQTPNKKEQKSFFEEQNEEDDIMEALYKYATDGEYDFLHINNYSSKPKYYKNLDEQIRFQYDN